jgi:oligopeptide transport system permease protein
MTEYIIRRALWMLPVLLSVGLITFTIARMTPGGPFDADREGRKLPASAERVLRAKFGMDLPIWRQFTRYMFFDIETDAKTKQNKIVWGALGGNLGPTYASRGAKTVQQEMFQGSAGKPSRFYYSARVGIQGMIIALLLGIPLGTIAALKQNTWIDYVSLLGATIFVALGSLVVALLLVLIFASGLRWFSVIPDWGQPIKPWILPSLALGLGSTGFITRLTRSSVLEVKRQDYVRTARSKGLAERTVIARHIVRNALLPVVTILGPAMAGLLTGTLFVERIFQVPGIGWLLIDAIGKRDYSMILGGALFYTFVLTVANLVVDLLYGVIDPRISFK